MRGVPSREQLPQAERLDEGVLAELELGMGKAGLKRVHEELGHSLVGAASCTLDRGPPFVQVIRAPDQRLNCGDPAVPEAVHRIVPSGQFVAVSKALAQEAIA